MTSEGPTPEEHQENTNNQDNPSTQTELTPEEVEELSKGVYEDVKGPILNDDGPPLTSGPPRHIQVNKPDPHRHDSIVRASYIIALLAVLSFIIIASFGTLWAIDDGPSRTDALFQVLGVVFTPIIGLISGATGFYFGERSSEAPK